MLNGMVSEEPEIPPPSAESVMLGVLVTAYLDELPRKRRRRFVQRVTERLEMTASWAKVARLRPSRHDADVALRIAEAQAWWRAASGVILAAVERE